MKGNAQAHTSNEKYRRGWALVFNNKGDKMEKKPTRNTLTIEIKDNRITGTIECKDEDTREELEGMAQIIMNVLKDQ